MSGKMVVVDGTYHEIDVDAPGIFDLFLALQQGYVESANIMFLIIFSYGFVYVLTKNGTMDKALGPWSGRWQTGTAAHPHYHAGSGRAWFHHGYL